MPQILPSLASANPLMLLEEMRRLGRNQPVHLDIEDGNFVPNITFGLSAVRGIVREAGAPLDAHLLVVHPADYIDELCNLGISQIAVHIESDEYPARLLFAIRSRGCRAGLALNLKTQLAEAEPFIDDLDYLLLMTSEPDGRGQMFCPRVLTKIQCARKMLPNCTQLWVDGGIGERELKLVTQSGADVAVIGRALFRAPDPAAEIIRLQTASLC